MKSSFLLPILFLVGLMAMPAGAANVVKRDHVTLSAAVETAASPGKTLWVAIRQDLQPGWHSYWRNPGTTGLATKISWQLPKGITAGAIVWPTPEAFRDVTGTDYGYRGTAVLLVPLSVSRQASAGLAKADISLLVCEHMCIPEEAVLDIDLGTPSADANLFASARQALPRLFAGHAALRAEDGKLRLVVHDPALTATTPRPVDFFPAENRFLDPDAASQAVLGDGVFTWTVPLRRNARLPARFDGVFRVGAVGYEIAGLPVVVATAAHPARAPSSETQALSVGGAMLLAFLGGLILNLMPCVLPILSMKALALLQGRADPAELRRDGLYYFAGVIGSFAVVAGTLLALKAGGAALGWGFQLQSPLFVLALVLLTGAVGMNLLGVFEVPLSIAGIGDTLTRQQGGSGAFFTGVLAVLVASPCTAPFMGTALGVALTAPPAIGAAIFLALGLGFALPFTAVAWLPGLARVVPKPGVWMNRLRQFLAFPMFATALWLLWVLGRQTGADGMLAALAIGLGIVFLAWVVPLLGGVWRWVAIAAGIAVFVGVAWTLSPVAAANTQHDAAWRPWSPSAVAMAERSGHPVLVDFSAAWCVTCLVNERTTFTDHAVTTAFADRGIVTLRADWTNGDAAITAALARFGRSGVPLYVYYPVRGAPVVLPQILTPQIVLSALSQKTS